MTVSGIRYGCIVRTQLEVELIPGIRVEEWTEEQDENGTITTIPLMRYWTFKDNAEDLLRPLLEMYPSDHVAWQDNLGMLLSMVLLQEKSGWSHQPTVERPAFWRRPFLKKKLFSEACAELQSRTGCRTLIKTDKGDLGLAPFWVREGDKYVN
jgi:hypothetical protein